MPGYSRAIEERIGEVAEITGAKGNVDVVRWIISDVVVRPRCRFETMRCRGVSAGVTEDDIKARRATSAGSGNFCRSTEQDGFNSNRAANHV